MAARLTDKQKKKIIADYVELGSYNAVAKKHGVSFDTVKRIVKNDPQIVKKTEQKKEQNTADMLTYMDSRKGKAQKLIDTYLDAMMDKERLEMASLNQIATAFGIIVDKFTKVAELKQPTNVQDDGLIRALESSAAHLFSVGDDSDTLPNKEDSKQ